MRSGFHFLHHETWFKKKKKNRSHVLTVGECRRVYGKGHEHVRPTLFCTRGNPVHYVMVLTVFAAQVLLCPSRLPRFS